MKRISLGCEWSLAARIGCGSLVLLFAPAFVCLPHSSLFASDLCGDADGSGVVDIEDIVYLTSFIFSGGPPPNPYSAGDVNCDQMVNISDVVYLSDYFYASGPPPCANCS